ncbi:hypothetical protein AVEN_41820-1, partial [Araneus ventricosus]
MRFGFTEVAPCVFACCGLNLLLWVKRPNVSVAQKYADCSNVLKDCTN